MSSFHSIKPIADAAKSAVDKEGDKDKASQVEGVE